MDPLKSGDLNKFESTSQTSASDAKTKTSFKGRTMEILGKLKPLGTPIKKIAKLQETIQSFIQNNVKIPSFRATPNKAPPSHEKEEATADGNTHKTYSDHDSSAPLDVAELVASFQTSEEDQAARDSIDANEAKVADRHGKTEQSQQREMPKTNPWDVYDPIIGQTPRQFKLLNEQFGFGTDYKFPPQEEDEAAKDNIHGDTKQFAEGTGKTSTTPSPDSAPTQKPTDTTVQGNKPQPQTSGVKGNKKLKSAAKTTTISSAPQTPQVEVKAANDSIDAKEAKVADRHGKTEQSQQSKMPEANPWDVFDPIIGQTPRQFKLLNEQFGFRTDYKFPPQEEG